MCRRMDRAVTVVALGLATLAASAAADPITATYRIDVAERCRTALGTCEPLGTTFSLMLRFDSTVTSGFDSTNGIVRRYGAPTFSAIPLARPEVFAGATELRSATDAAVLVPPFDWRRVAQAALWHQFATEEVEYRWFLGLEAGQDFFPSAPVLSAQSMAAFLGRSTAVRSFGYSFFGRDRLTGQLTPDSVGYRGTITPVPEPASLLLAGGGMAMCIRRFRSRRQQSDEADEAIRT